MALFSRRKNSPPEETPAQGVEPGEQPIEPTDASSASGGADPTSGPGEAAEPSPEVTISMSAFRGVGAAVPPVAAGPAAAASTESVGGTPSGQGTPTPPRRVWPEEAPPPSESMPGLRDNALLASALAALSPTPTGPELLDVARQLLQGHLFLRVQGDARALLSAGQPLPLSMVAMGDKRYVLAYSGGAALQAAVRADGDTKTSAMGQPVLAVIRHVLSNDFEGIILDNNSAPARAVLPRAILQRALDDTDEQLRIKTLLSAPRTDSTATDVALALTEAPLWIAVKRTGADGAVGVAETRTAEGERFLEVFSHPLEAVALARGDSTAPITAVQLATALSRDARLTGLVVNPAGPWIRLRRDDLAPLLALAP